MLAAVVLLVVLDRLPGIEKMVRPIEAIRYSTIISTTTRTTATTTNTTTSTTIREDNIGQPLCQPDIAAIHCQQQVRAHVSG